MKLAIVSPCYNEHEVLRSSTDRLTALLNDLIAKKKIASDSFILYVNDGERVQFDLGKTKNLNYYTGIVFEAYVEGVGKRVLSGGRYDTLLEKYGRNLPAVGFSIKLDALAEIGEMIQPPKETVITYHPSRRIEAMKKAKELVETTKITLIADESANELTIKEG